MAKKNIAVSEEDAFLASLGTKKTKAPANTSSASSISSLLDDPDDGRWEKPSPLSWFRMVNGHRLDYRPHLRSWQYRGKTKSGDVLKFIAQQTK